MTRKKVVESEPVAMLGYGTVSYIKMLHFFQWVFFGLSILQIPTIYIYSKGSAIPDVFKSLDTEDEGVVETIASKASATTYENFMLGNLGYSAINCDLTPVNVERIGMLCNYGTIG